MTTTEHVPHGAPTAADLASWIPMFRQLRIWTQDQLAEISGLSVRTIQRVEKGGNASFDTRRALARAFGFSDIDALNKPTVPLTDDEMKSIQDKAANAYVRLLAHPLTSGQDLARLAEGCEVTVPNPSPDMPRPAAEAFARMIDDLRDFREYADAYTETQKLEIHNLLQTHIDTLTAHRYTLRYATRRVSVVGGVVSLDAVPLQCTVLYVAAFGKGHNPDYFVAPKDVFDTDPLTSMV